MEAQLPVPLSPQSQNRKPTRQELDHGATILRSLGNELLAKRVECSDDPASGEESLVVVASDLDHVGDEQVILVPPGVHFVPIGLLEPERYIVGLSPHKGTYPVLILNGEPGNVINTDTLEDSPLHICPSSATLACFKIDAQQPTVVETYFGEEKQFSEVFFQITWGPNADALNTGAYTFYNGWKWALDAYGSLYRGRNSLESGLDSLHQGVMTAIDATFRPLVRFGEKLDQVLGLK